MEGRVSTNEAGQVFIWQPLGWVTVLDAADELQMWHSPCLPGAYSSACDV